ncbi:MAG TPA: hypothetical protein VNQ32_09600 [Steroidobacteraceae bacterium]|nr:hypothetical protein [Steroidobacteraceae bacterium]
MPPLSRTELAYLIRARLPSLMLDVSGMPPAGFAIYTLSDPRDLRQVRYVGQTRLPRRRLLQHLNCARLWLPDEVPWWFGSPELRPLYEWIRALHRDEYRLPAMLVTAWTSSSAEARLAERELIMQHLADQHELLNFERELAARQSPLL